MKSRNRKSWRGKEKGYMKRKEQQEPKRLPANQVPSQSSRAASSEEITILLSSKRPLLRQSIQFCNTCPMQTTTEQEVPKSKSRHHQLKSDAKISWYISRSKISSRWSITCANRANSSKDNLLKVKMHQMRSIGIQKLLKRMNFLTKKTKLDLNTWVHSPIRLIKRKLKPSEPERNTPHT